MTQKGSEWGVVGLYRFVGMYVKHLMCVNFQLL